MFKKKFLLSKKYIFLIKQERVKESRVYTPEATKTVSNAAANESRAGINAVGDTAADDINVKPNAAPET